MSKTLAAEQTTAAPPQEYIRMATIEKSAARSPAAAPAPSGQVTASPRFDWLFTLFSTLLTGGIFLDGWAHTHGKVDQSFFTPWHAVLYSAFLLIGAFLFLTLLINHRNGYPWRHALPAGYQTSLLGAVIFGVGGVGDLAWHLAFGIEQGIEGLLSPSHLTLALGGMLMGTGPLRAAWQRRDARSPGWAALAPALLALTYTLSLLTFFTQYAHPIIRVRVDELGLGEIIGVVSIELQSALLMGIVLLAIRRWRLPFGALALLFALNILLTLQLSQSTPVLLVVLLYAILGLAADLLNRWLQPSAERVGALRLFAFAVPFLIYSVYFLVILALGGEIAWSVHVWTGSIVLAGIAGLLLSYLTVPPRLPTEAEGL
jgi:hypothetical protein